MVAGVMELNRCLTAHVVPESIVMLVLLRDCHTVAASDRFPSDHLLAHYLQVCLMNYRVLQPRDCVTALTHDVISHSASDGLLYVAAPS